MRSVMFGVMSLVMMAGSVQASETSWVNHDGMLQTRIIASSEKTANGKLILAWEAKLAPGWKTYWRSPGEAGLPVKISSGGEKIDVRYPFPKRFELFGLETYGYGKQVIMPFYVEPSANVPVKVDFMVCKDICVPFNVNYTIDTSNIENSSHDFRIAAWNDKVPAETGDDGAGLEITSVKLVGKPGHQKIIVDAKAAAGTAKADMLAEVNELVHFGKPKVRLMADGKTARFVLSAITGNKTFDLRGQQVRLSFSNGRGASIERTMPL